MGPATTITTSWDDGHPLDFRVAELLADADDFGQALGQARLKADDVENDERRQQSHHQKESQAAQDVRVVF